MQYVWGFGPTDGQDAALAHLFLVPGVYNVGMTVVNASGQCGFPTKTIKIEVKKNDPSIQGRDGGGRGGRG